MHRCLPGAAAVVLALSAAARPAPAADVFQPLDARQVRVGGEIGRRIEITLRNNLLALDADKDFLKPFQDRNRNDGYIGLGKLIDAAVRFAHVTGDDKALALKKRLVAGAIQTQEPDGYIGLLKPEKRVWALWDVHEMGYLVYGLTMDHRFFGEADSLAAAQKLADYILARWSAEPQRAPGNNEITVHMAVTGIENAMLALHRQTKDAKYLDFVRDFRKTREWDAKIALGRFGPIEGHAYAHLCRCIAQLRLDRIEPDARLLKPSRDVLDFLLTRDGLTIPGEFGDHECWHDTQEGTINLGETCATAYFIRFLDELIRLEGLASHGDLMERALFNGLFGAQSPDGRKVRYYTPFDGPRDYFKGDTYCCPCNYRRIVPELPGMVCYGAEGGLAVNLYAASEATATPAEGLTVKVTQETDYPASGRIAIRLDPSRPAAFPLRLRLPRWCEKPSVKVNGEAAAGPLAPGTFAVVAREWKAGDRVELDFPMPARFVKGRKAQDGKVAVMRGPQLYGLNRARHPGLKDVDLRIVVIDPATLEGPVPDDSVRPGGTACRVKAWKPGAWYPFAKHDYTLTLTEYADPGCEAVYFKVPNPGDARFVEDELVATGKK
jgi:DUF1680 family protein